MSNQPQQHDPAENQLAKPKREGQLSKAGDTRSLVGRSLHALHVGLQALSEAATGVARSDSRDLIGACGNIVQSALRWKFWGRIGARPL